MRILVLGGTAWLGGEVAQVALERGHDVTCLARGESGQAPPGVHMLAADRSSAAAYGLVTDQDWDGVVDVSWQPGFVRGAVAALADRAATWVYVSSGSVYAAHGTPGADEGAALLPALEGDVADRESYGEAKVACEQAVLAGVGPDRTVIARSGLIGGPGDHSDRTGYWPLRFAHPATDDAAVLVPDTPDLGTQVIDVRDLARWLVESVEQERAGVFNLLGDVTPLGEHLATARRVAGHDGPLVPVSSQWLVDHGVEEWAGERSLPLWLHSEGWEAFGHRSNAAARESGLLLRPLEDTLRDTLAWELQAGPGRPRKAGLSPGDERDLIAKARA
ncbi:MAG TPA: NAD-dependent epimerase/dehydratase family protein [Oryzihumus sp.]|nr:NAD-dependent epimerase/dehydratase family protein [Oryzihumus sp.]